MSIALVFPGQGSQAIGMGQDFYNNFTVARDVFHEVDEALNEKLSQLIFEGPLDTLTLTRNTQPALMAVSVAIMRTLEAESGIPAHQIATFAAGHSLGEYSALTASGAFDVTTAAKLLRIRGDAMQVAAPVGQGAMAALMGGSIELAEELAQECALGEVCCIANDNATDQQVISGHKDAVQRAVEQAAAKGFKRGIPLPVSAPFHSPLMEPAAEVMRNAFSDISWGALTLPIVANVTAEPVTVAKDFASHLVTQVAGRVRWRESLIMLQTKGISQIIEVGSGKVLCGLAKRTTPDVNTLAINTVADIKQFIDTMR